MAGSKPATLHFPLHRGPFLFGPEFLDAAERYLASQIDQQRSVLLRKGIDPMRAEQELTALSSAVRAALWREIILRRGGGVA